MPASSPAQPIAGIIGVLVATFAASAAIRVVAVNPQAATRREARLEEDVLSSPGRNAMQLAAMEHAESFADIFWLQIVQELGKGEQSTAAGWDRMQRWANIAVDLAPKYYNVYYATSIHLIVYAKRDDPSEALLKKGQGFLPDRWEIPFLLGYIEYFLRADPAKAASYWESTATMPGTPRFLPSLAARSRAHAGDDEGAIAMLESMLEHLEGPHREDAEIRIKLLKSDIRMRAYDAACERYRKERGAKPKDGAELLALGMVSEPAEDLLGNPITIDDDCIARSKIVTVREFEAKKRAGSQAASTAGAKMEADPAKQKTEENTP